MASKYSSHTQAQATLNLKLRKGVINMGGDILRLVFASAMVTTLAGIVIGLAAAFGLTRLLQSLLYQVTATDPVVFVTIPLLLLAVAAIATYLPARRAMKVDPITALREP